MNSHPSDDKVLIDQYLSGNQSCFEVLYKRHREKVFSSIYFLVRDRELAEDLFQETFVKVICTLRAGQYREEGKFLPWVVRIAHNLVIDHFRKEKQMPKLREREEYSIFDRMRNNEKNSQDLIAEEQQKAILREMISRLPDEQREVLIMRMYGEMSFKEIAKVTGVSINTALGRMRYALIHLRKVMDENKINLYA